MTGLNLPSDSSRHCATSATNGQIHRVHDLFIKLSEDGTPQFITPTWLCGTSSSRAKWISEEETVDSTRLCRFCELGHRFPGPNVYFIEISPGILKIGQTTQVARRMRAHGEFRFLGAVEGERPLERAFHEDFEPKFGSDLLPGRELFRLDTEAESLVRAALEDRGAPWVNEQFTPRATQQEQIPA